MDNGKSLRLVRDHRVGDSSVCYDSYSDSYDSSSHSQLPLRKQACNGSSRASDRKEPRDEPPPTMMQHERMVAIQIRQDKRREKNMKCLFCRKMRPGQDNDHEQSTCIHAFMDKCAHINTDCKRGYHLPMLHGVWRCAWCDRHMKDDDVKNADPEQWQFQWEREWSNRMKYNNPPYY